MNRISPPTGVHARPVATPGKLARSPISCSNFAGTKDGIEIGRVNTHLELRIFVGDAHGCMAHHAADLPFQLPYPGLTRVIRNNALHRLDRYFTLLFAQTIRFALTCNQVTQRDLKFFLAWYNPGDR